MSIKYVYPIIHAICITILSIATLQAQNELIPPFEVMINEVNINDAENDDVFFELVVVGKTANPCALQVPGTDLVIDDNNEGDLGSFQPGYITINSTCIEDAKKGDKIIIYGKNANIGSAYARYKFRIDDSCIKKWADQPNHEYPQYNGKLVLDNSVKLKDFLLFNKNENGLQVRTRDQEIQKIIQKDGQTNYSLTHGVFDKYKQKPPSPAAANNEGNRILLESIENTPELYIEAEVFSANNRGQNIENDIKIHICGGTPPYKLIDEDGLDSYSVDPEFTVYDASCGSHLINVFDNHGFQSTTSAEILVEQNIYIDICVDELLSFDLLECLNVEDPCYAWFPEALFEDLPDGNKTEAPEIYLDSSDPNQIITLKISNREGEIINIYYYHVTIYSDLDGDGFCGENDPDEDNACIPVNSLNVEISGTETICSGETVTLTCTSGDDYEWSTGETTQSITVASGGNYNVTLSDDNGCNGEATFFLAEYETPIATLDPYVEICMFNGVPTHDTYLIVDGSDDYQYVWSTGHVGKSINLVQQNLGVGIYSVTVTNEICSVVLEAEVVENTSGNCCENDPLVMTYTGDLEICPGGSTTLYVTVTGGTAPYEIITNPNAVVTETGLGQFEVVVTGETIGFALGAQDAYWCGSQNPDETRVFLDIVLTDDIGDDDNDGICNGLDEDPDDPCIPEIDTDQDGLCDGIDCDPDDYLVGTGFPCDDSNACTVNDVYDEDCNCVGELIEGCDCESLGSPCDDGDFCTTNDVILENCLCAGEEIPGCDECVEGQPCDDGDDCTIDDQVVYGCECVGTIVESGESCDDGNDCTIDDQYNEDCECTGTPVVAGQECDDMDPCTPFSSYEIVDGVCTCTGESEAEFDIIQSWSGECEPIYGSLAVNSVFDDYRWELNGEFISELQECPITEYGTYSIQVRNENGCELEKELSILDFNQPSIEIEASSNVICNANATVQLGVNGSWQDRKWTGPNGENLGSNYEIAITNRGLYRFEGTDSNGCERFGEVFINQSFEPFIEIKQVEPELCLEENFTLYIDPLDIEAVVTWSGPGIVEYISEYEIIVNIPGEYSVTVISQDQESEGCQAIDKYLVIDPGSPIDIEQILIQNGFIAENISVGEVSLLPPGSITYKSLSECGTFEDLSFTTYKFVEFSDRQFVVDDLNSEEEGLINTFICNNNNCSETYGGVLINSLCADGGMDLDEFLAMKDDYDHTFLYYIQHDINDVPNKIFHYNNSKCVPISNEPETFEAFLFDLICALKKYRENPSDKNRYLSLTQYPRKPYFTSGQTVLFDGNTYDGVQSNKLVVNPKLADPTNFNTDHGFFVSNFMPGGEIDLSLLEWKQTDTDVLTSCSDNLELDDVASLTLNYNDCVNKLKIFYGKSEYQAFKDVVLTPEDFASDANSLDNDAFLENYPPCIGIDVCNVLNSQIPECGGTTSDGAAEKVLHTLKYALPTQYETILDCIESNQLIYRYHCSNLINERDFLKHVLRIYLQSSRYGGPASVNNDVIFDGERYAFLAGSFYHNQFHPTKVSTRHDKYNFLIDYEYAGDAEFDYFKNYIIRVGNKFNFLGSGNKLPPIDGEEKKELFDIKVPGFYVPYATLEWNKTQFDEDIELTIQALSVAVSFLGFPPAAVVGRWATFQRAMAFADVANEASKLFLLENFCKCTLPNEEIFCEKWKEITQIADYILLGGSILDAGNTLYDLRRLYNELDPPQKAILKKAISEEVSDTETIKQINKLLDGLAILGDLKKCYPKFNNSNPAMFQAPDGPFYKLATWAEIEGIPLTGLLDHKLAKRLDDTGNGKEFIDKIVATHSINKPDALVRSLHKLNPDVYDTWLKVRHTSPNLSKNMAVMDELTKVRTNPELNYVLSLKFPPPGEPWENLLTTLKSYDWGCSTCGGRKPWIEIVLRDLNTFSVLYKSRPGYDKVVHTLGSGWKKAKGTHWVMNFSVSKNLKKPEFEVPTGGNGQKVADIFAEGKFYECKSWGNNLLVTGNFKSQFKDYFTNMNLTIEDIGFYFHPNSDNYYRWSKPEITPNDLKVALTNISNADPTYFDFATFEDQYKRFFDFSTSEMNLINQDVGKLIDKIVEKHFDNIIRNTN